MKDNSAEINANYYIDWRNERQRRVLIALIPAFISIVTAIIASQITDYIELPTPTSKIVLNIIAVIMFFLSSVALLMIYLQTGFSKKTESTIYQYLQSKNSAKEHHPDPENNINHKELESVKKELSELRELTHNNFTNTAITTEVKDELIAQVRNDIISKGANQATKEFLDKIEKETKKSNQIQEVETVFSHTLERLYLEIKALSRRGNLNLSLGIITTIIGLVILGYFVINRDIIAEDKISFIVYFIPRLSLVLLIEIFAYFFLKLYKSSLSDIKYFQNEMTNVESKLAAIKCSLITADSDATTNVIRVLSETDRNSVLEKGQTTVEIEKAKIEQQSIATLSEKVSKILTGNSSG